MTQPLTGCYPVVLRLTRILDAEAKGEPFDRNEAARLATVLRGVCPGIAGSMRGIADRMGPGNHTAAG